MTVKTPFDNVGVDAEAPSRAGEGTKSPAREPPEIGYERVREEQDAVVEFMEKEERRRKQVEEAPQPKAATREASLFRVARPALLVRSPRDGSSPATVVERQGGASTLWTEARTPTERQQRLADEVVGELDVRSGGRSPRNAQTRRAVGERRKAYSTRRTCAVELVDMHLAAGKSAEKDEVPKAVWDRDRDMGHGGRLVDAEKGNKMINKGFGS
uniref:DUF3752 domain-containing protein n=1 Tax=Mycena chlorophos TaxID=658473 RepID=A0ABQ0LG92_MYCCL|nr:predicted protein [Mycena chlorophos]